MSVADVEVGRLIATTVHRESMLFGSTAQAAAWLAYVGLCGRFAWCMQHWMRWNGYGWERCETRDVHRAIRHTLGSVYDEHMEAKPTPEQVMQLLRLMDLNWRLGPLMHELRWVVTVDPERVE